MMGELSVLPAFILVHSEFGLLILAHFDFGLFILVHSDFGSFIEGWGRAMEEFGDQDTRCT